MGSSDPDDYCPFTKAIEHLGDRWSLLILRQLGAVGPLGFNALATGIPGRIPRSVLLDRIRRLEDLGLICRGNRHDRELPYRLTAAGHGPMPMLLELRGWAATWFPDDPTLVERDPDVLPGWLARRLDPAMLPRREVLLEIRSRGRAVHCGWLVLRSEVEPYGCLDDPMLDRRGTSTWKPARRCCSRSPMVAETGRRPSTTEQSSSPATRCSPGNCHAGSVPPTPNTLSCGGE